MIQRRLARRLRVFAMPLYYDPDKNEITSPISENKKTPVERARDRVAWFRQIDWIKASRSLTKTEFNVLRKAAEAATRDVGMQYCRANGIAEPSGLADT